MMDNLRRVVPPSTDAGRLRWLTRQAFRNLLWSYYELFHVPGYQLDELRSRATVDGAEHFDAALQAGRGGVFVFTHCGNMEVLAQIALYCSHNKCIVIAEHMKDERIFRLISETRAGHGLVMIPVDQILRAVRMLKQNWIVMVAGDLDRTNSGIVVEFFGSPARLPDGAVQLALRLGVPLFMANGWRDQQKNGAYLWTSPPTFQARIFPILLERSGDFERDVRSGVEQYVKHLEGIIRAHPDQWHAFEPIWLEE
jgi:phosphatidylinositol dimannoside acyltransferase